MKKVWFPLKPHPTSFSLSISLANSKPTNLVVRIISSNRERRYSYAIGTISITLELTWLELEKICIKLFLDHITQIDTPFDYVKSSIGCTANHIDTLSLGLTKWHYQDSPNDDSPPPYTAAREQDSIFIQLKGVESNATESLAYNYFIPSQNLKNFIRFVCVRFLVVQIEMNSGLDRTKSICWCLRCSLSSEEIIISRFNEISRTATVDFD